MEVVTISSYLYYGIDRAGALIISSSEIKSMSLMILRAFYRDILIWFEDSKVRDFILYLPSRQAKRCHQYVIP